MRDRSSAFDATVRGSHTAVCRVDVIQDDKTVRQLDVHAGFVTADRAAAQLRSFEAEVSDPTSTLTPEGMASLLAPFGTRLRLSRGVRITDVDTRVALSNTEASWAVTTEPGVNNGTRADPTDGALVLGP